MENSERATISVALTTYNGERFLREQLDSILDQTLVPDEIVIVDDCSNDNTHEILQDYAARYPHMIRVYYNEINLGFIKNFERAISLCNSQYIALSDQDDIWMSKKIETLLNACGDNLLVHSDAYLVNTVGTVLHESCSKSMRKIVRPVLYNILYANVLTGCTMLIHRDLFRISVPFPAGIPHDWWLSLVALAHGAVSYSPEKLVKYRQHDANSIGCIIQNDVSVKRRVISFIRKTGKIFKIRNSRTREIMEHLDLLHSANHLVKDEHIQFHDAVRKLNSFYSSKTRTISFRAFFLRLRFFWQLFKTDNENLLFHILLLCVSFVCGKRDRKQVMNIGNTAQE